MNEEKNRCKCCGKPIDEKKVYCNRKCYMKKRDLVNVGRKKTARHKCKCGCGKTVEVLGQMFFNRKHAQDFKNTSRISRQKRALQKRDKTNHYLIKNIKDKKYVKEIFDKAHEGDSLAIEALQKLHVTKIYRKGREMLNISRGGIPC